MSPAAKEEMLAAPMAWSREEIFSLAAGVAAALAPRQGTNAARGKKSHQGIFPENRSTHISEMWVKYSGTHQLSEWRASKTVLGPTVYLYDRKNLIEEIDQSGNVLARYTQGKRLDEPLAELRQGTTSYYEQDGLGSVTSLSNSAGAVAETYAYDSYGKVTASTGTLVNPFQYTGREFDSETGVYYYRARYFDPSTGRFLSQDPIRYGGGVNFYAYTRNNPVVRIDPFGYDGTCTNPAYCVPGSPTWGTMYLGPDGTWYNDGPPPDPAPPVPDDGPTPPPNPPAPNKTCDQPGDQPPDQPPPDQPEPIPPLVPERTCVKWTLADAWVFGFVEGSALFGQEEIALPVGILEGGSVLLHRVVCGEWL
jgi:RHS repeat-associated protein